MKAIVHERYGSPDVLEFKDVDDPRVGEKGVLVRVRAASVNALDWRFMRADPHLVRMSEGLRRPKRTIPGVDLAGVVEAVGPGVTKFKPGDEVFGARGGAFAEYLLGVETNFITKPDWLTFEQAAAIPTAACTALNGLRDYGAVRPGQSVLVNGAGGGVGTFAVQIAKAMGAEVTAVCSSRNVEQSRSLGADDVVDYTKHDFTRSGRRYDVILDNVANRSLTALRRVLARDGTLVIDGGGKGKLVGPFKLPLKAMVVSKFVRQKMVFYVAKIKLRDLELLTGWVEAGKVTPVIDRTYPLSDAADAIRYVETGHARGKVVVTV